MILSLPPECLEEAITPKTKVVIIPFPNNPTGAIMTREELEKIVDVLKDKDIIILSDEIYAELSYDKKHVSIASFPEVKDKTLVINGFSKAYAMTGWRLGYVCGHTGTNRCYEKDTSICNNVFANNCSICSY